LPRTLVTGATGFLGSHLTRMLVRRGDEVRALVRPSSDLDALAELDVGTVRGDVLDRRSVRRAMRGVDRVFHTAGTTNLRLPREAMVALNVEGTRIVLEESLRAGVERVVYTSSVAAIGPARAGAVATACSSARAKRELGWRTSPHEDCLEETIAWYRDREGPTLSPPGSRQPVALRVAGAFVRHAPLGWG
jgi:nucleoside-diphosphate-sugar epimerase